MCVCVGGGVPTWQSFEKYRSEGIHMLGHSLRDVEEQVMDPLQRRHLN